MIVQFGTRFSKDIRSIEDRDMRKRIGELIVQIEDAAGLQDIPDLKKLKGFAHYYRIRVGNYRIGLSLVDEGVELIRCLDRKDIYRYFP